MATSRTQPRARGSGGYLAITVVALLVAVYLAFHVIGFLFKLFVLAAATLIGLGAWRAWRAPA